MTLDSATFQRAWGRAPSEASLARLRRLREAFEIGENDGLLTIASVFEFYDDLYRQYPEQCADAARQALRDGLSSAASLCVGAIQQALEERLASLEPRIVSAARRAMREELSAHRIIPFPVAQPLHVATARAWVRMPALWLAYSTLLSLVCWWGGCTSRDWVALMSATAGFAGVALLTQFLWR